MNSIVPYSKTIPLTQGKEAIVGWWWHPFLSIWEWCAHFRGNNWYAERGIYLGGGRKNAKYKTIMMHNIIKQAPAGQIVDHEKRNGLDNTEGNLRFASNSQNLANRKVWGVSKFKGVSPYRYGKQYISRIRKNGKLIRIGTYPHTPCGELLAAIEYDNKAIELHGEFANLNFK